MTDAEHDAAAEDTAEERQATPQEIRADIMAAPEPMQGPPIHERTKSADGAPTEDGYVLVMQSLARAMLILCEEDPSLLDVSAEREADETGFKAADNEKLWKAVQARWPEINVWLGGITGFQYGIAHQAVRYVLDAEPVGNPAIVTVKTGDGEDGEPE